MMNLSLSFSNRCCLVFLLLLSCRNIDRDIYPAVKNDILIVYSSGQPYKTLSDISLSEIDAVTSATPVDMNCRIIAYKLADVLRQAGRKVKVLRTDELHGINEILGSRVLIIGSPSRYWGMSWETKKMFDEIFSDIYIAHKKDFAGLKVFSFSMAEIERCAASTNKAIHAALTDCGNKPDTSFVFTTKNSLADYDLKIGRAGQVILSRIN